MKTVDTHHASSNGTLRNMRGNEGDDTPSFVVCGSVFDVGDRYAPIKPIGKGAYGVVW